MPESTQSLLTVEVAQRIRSINENSVAAMVMVQAMALERQALEIEVLRLRSVNGELHGQIGLLEAKLKSEV